MKNIITVQLEKHYQETWSAAERENVEMVVDFVQHLMNNHDFEYVRNTYLNSRYTQHNRNISDGMESIIKYVEDFSKRFPEFTYDVKRVIADGDLVIFHSHATLRAAHRDNDRKGMNIVDIWKIENGQIVEHWDAIQPLDLFMRLYVLMTGGSIKNTNGVF